MTTSLFRPQLPDEHDEDHLVYLADLLQDITNHLTTIDIITPKQRLATLGIVRRIKRKAIHLLHSHRNVEQ